MVTSPQKNSEKFITKISKYHLKFIGKLFRQYDSFSKLHDTTASDSCIKQTT